MSRLGQITGSNSATFDPARDMPSLESKVIVVTGGDSGIGKQAISYLAQSNPAEIWMVTKDLDGAKTACQEIQQQAKQVTLRPLQVDLGSFQSIRRAADTLKTKIKRLDILMLNAGVMGTPALVTEDGYEHQFGINYLGHALFTELLLPVLLGAAENGHDARIIAVSSYSHRNAPDGGIQFDTLKTSGESLPTLKRYAQSKLCNILFVRQLAARYPQLTAVAIHPGAAQTNLIRDATGAGLLDRFVGKHLYNLFMFQPIEVVAKHQVWATTAEGLISGEYYEPLGVAGQGRPEIKDEELGRQLWEWTQREFQPHLI